MAAPGRYIRWHRHHCRALRCDARDGNTLAARRRWIVVALSLLLSIGISSAAMAYTFRVRGDRSGSPRKLIGALLFGAAVSLTHIEESALRLPHLDAVPIPHPAIPLLHFGLVIARVAIALLLLVATITALIDRNRMQTELKRASVRLEAPFRTLAEAIPQIVWIADASGRTTYINRRWYEMTGTPQGKSLGGGWIESVHPDDRDPCNEKWQKCVRSGETFEIEYRLHDALHGYRWYLDRAVPLRDDHGTIQQWFGTCTDIEEQKLYQQTLEQLIKERTEELATANTRLQQEMWERDLARRTLDEQNEKMMSAL